MPGPTFAANDLDYISKLNQLANALLSISIQNTNFTAAKGYRYILTASGLVVTLPSSPVSGDRLEIRSGGSAITAVTIGRNGSLINSVASDLAISGGTDNDVNIDIEYVNSTVGWRVSRYGAAAPTVVGKQTLWFPAGSITPRTTNGAVASTTELATNKIMVNALEFDAATAQYAQMAVRMPKQWNESTISFQAIWSHASTTTNFGVVWGLRALALSDDDAMDTAMGTGVTVTDTGGTTNDLYASAESGAITIGNTPAENDTVILEVYRDAANGSDTMAINARLLGVVVFITTNAAVDN